MKTKYAYMTTMIGYVANIFLLIVAYLGTTWVLLILMFLTVIMIVATIRLMLLNKEHSCEECEERHKTVQS